MNQEDIYEASPDGLQRAEVSENANESRQSAMADIPGEWRRIDTYCRGHRSGWSSRSHERVPPGT